MDFDTKGANILVDTWRKRDWNTVKKPLLIIKFESLNKLLVFSVFTGFTLFFQISGPLSPLSGHSMVRLRKGQAILGGSGDFIYRFVFLMTCSNRNCIISLLNKVLSAPKQRFVAIPIPDTISECITGGKNHIQK